MSCSTVSALHDACHQQCRSDCPRIVHQPGGAQPCLLRVTAHGIHTIAAAQTAIDHQPSSQCSQASWVPPRQDRQPPSGRAHSVCRPRAGCLLGAVASQHAHSPAPLGRSCLLLPWPAPGDHAPMCGPPVRPSCPSCQPVSHCLCILHRWSCILSAIFSGPELYRTYPCLRSCLQARQLHLVQVGIQVSACRVGDVSCIMPWQSSFPSHRMCCRPETLLLFALSVFRIADMIGIDGHVV